MKKIEIHSLCVKIVLFLNYRILKKDELLYLISLSDFYYHDTMSSKNIKNINSLSYYTKAMNEALALLLATNMITFYGDMFKLSAKGKVFNHNLMHNNLNTDLIKKINYIVKQFGDMGNLDKIYDELVNKFILKNVGGEYNEN